MPSEENGAAPAAVPLERARAHLRVDHVEEDALIGGYVDAALEHAETVCRRALLEGAYELSLDGFPRGAGAIELPHPPGAALALEDVRYVDPAGEARELDAAQVRLLDDLDPAVVLPVWGTCWPATRRERGAVRIRFVAEYGAGAIPPGITQALLMMVGHWYANRESVALGTIATQVPAASEALLWPHRLLRFG